jgi:hypothetical protein
MVLNRGLSSCDCVWEGSQLVIRFPDTHTTRLVTDWEQERFLEDCGLTLEDLDEAEMISECPSRWRRVA